MKIRFIPDKKRSLFGEFPPLSWLCNFIYSEQTWLWHHDWDFPTCIVEISRMTESRSLWLLNKQDEEHVLSQRTWQQEEQRSYYSPDYTAQIWNSDKTSPRLPRKSQKMGSDNLHFCLSPWVCSLPGVRTDPARHPDCACQKSTYSYSTI